MYKKCVNKCNLHQQMHTSKVFCLSHVCTCCTTCAAQSDRWSSLLKEFKGNGLSNAKRIIQKTFNRLIKLFLKKKLLFYFPDASEKLSDNSPGTASISSIDIANEFAGLSFEEQDRLRSEWSQVKMDFFFSASKTIIRHFVLNDLGTCPS